MVEEDFYNLRNIKEDIKKEYPGYYSQVESLEIKERPPVLNFPTVSPMKFGNVCGHWLAANISTPSKVVDAPITLELLKKELEKDRYTHICVSAFLDGFENFKKCMEYLTTYHKDIKRVLGNVGTQYPQFRKYFDKRNICYGDGVPFLRELLGESAEQPYRIPSTVGYIEMLGDVNSKLPAGVLTTATGCPHHCDFCSTTSLFNGKYKSYDFTVEDIYSVIKEMERKIGSNEFLIFLAEPNAFLDKKFWYMTYEHNYLGKEFHTLPKLMLDMYDYIESKTGHPFLKILEVKLHQRYPTNLRDLDYLHFLFNSYSQIHNDWVNYFCPGPGNYARRRQFKNRFGLVKSIIKNI